MLPNRWGEDGRPSHTTACVRACVRASERRRDLALGASCPAFGPGVMIDEGKYFRLCCATRLVRGWLEQPRGCSAPCCVSQGNKDSLSATLPNSPGSRAHANPPASQAGELPSCKHPESGAFRAGAAPRVAPVSYSAPRVGSLSTRPQSSASLLNRAPCLPLALCLRGGSLDGFV